MTDNLHISETMVNVTAGYRFGPDEHEITETFTDDPGELYRALQREYGRCTGKVYVDTADGTKRVGWVFLKRAEYEDSSETFLQETWVTLHDAPDTVTRERHYHALAS